MNQAQLVRLCRIVIMLLVAVLALSAAHWQGLVFQGIRFASGALAVHSGLTALLLQGFLWVAARHRAPAPSGIAVFRAMIAGLSLAGIALIDIAIGMAALYRLDPETIAFAALFPVGLLCGHAYLRLGRVDRKEGAPDAGESARVAAAATGIPAARLLTSHFATGLRSALVVAALVLIVPAGFGYYYYLHDAYLGALPWDADKIAQVAGTLFGAFWAVPVGLAGLVIAVAGSVGIARAAVQRRRKRVQPDIDRDLTDDELALVRDCTQILERHAAGMKTPRSAKLVARQLPVVLAIGVGAGLFTLFLNDIGLGGAQFMAARTAGHTAFLYHDPIGPAEILLVFVGMLLAASVPAYLGRRWGALAEYSLLKAKIGFRFDGDPLGALRRDIALDVRKRLIRDPARFDPGAYLRVKGRDHGRRLFAATVGLGLATAGFWYLDRRDYDLLTPDDATYVDYWTGRIFRSAYGEAEGIEATCYRGEKGKFKLSYGILFPDGHRVSVIDATGGDTLATRLAAVLPLWRAADARLRAAGVPRAFERRDLAPGKGEVQFLPDLCASEIGRHLDAPVATEIMDLLSGSAGTPR